MNRMLTRLSVTTLWGRLLLGVFWPFAGAATANELADTVEVGPVKVVTTLAPETPMIGDEVTLEIRVEAERDVEVLMPEFGEALDRYRILDFVPRQRIEDDGRMVLSQRYTLQPQMSGEQSIPPILVEFVDNRPGSQPTPDDYDAYEVLTNRLDFTVQSVVAGSSSAELKPPQGELQRQRGPPGATPWLWIGGGLLLFLALGSAAVVWTRRVRSRVIRRNAYEVARGRLDRLLRDRSAAEPKLTVEQFFVEISSIVRRYLEDRFELKAPELTTEEFLLRASDHREVSREHQNLLREFLRQADLVKFAHAQPTDAEARRSSTLAQRFLEETRENAPLIEDARDSEPLEAADA